MPKLEPHELGSVGPLRCRRVDCESGAMIHGAGFQLPFCRSDLARLSRRTFNALVRVSGQSVYDVDAVSEAAALVASARLELRGKRAKRA